MDQTGTSDIFSDLHVDTESRSLLQATTKWARITAIIGIVSAVVTLLTTVFGLSAGGNQLMTAFMSGSLIVIIPMVIVIVILNIFLYRFSHSTATSLSTMDQNSFNQGISHLRTYFKILGIVIIVLIGFVLIVIIAFGLGAAVG